MTVRRCVGTNTLVRAVALTTSLMLGACGTVAPPLLPSPEPEPTTTAGVVAMERRLVEAAALQERQGHLADEAISLELLLVLKPAEPHYAAQLQTLRSRIATAVQDRMQRGAAAQKRGQRDVAMSHYLAALALRPDDEAAANALRALERDRNRRLLVVKPRPKVPAPAEGEE